LSEEKIDHLPINHLTKRIAEFKFDERQAVSIKERKHEKNIRLREKIG